MGIKYGVKVNLVRLLHAASYYIIYSDLVEFKNKVYIWIIH